MAIIKCKMCGGDLEILEDSSVCECEYCGTKQTVPKVDDEKKLKLFERANRLRTACEFDKAAGVYETIVADFDQEAEAYWGLILCKFGIEYVDDPGTGKKIPTCHRSSFESLMDDPNFEMVMECADPVARRVYREEAKQIEELRKGIIEVSAKEEPYDVFISYKELDDNGERTLDSVIAQDIYTELTDKGYRVFFSRISLEDKLGVEYEPYIFAALNSAKVMIVVGTDYDYFNAVWVKNEWSRFLALIVSGQKKTLIPVFKGIDAYDMPKEFAKLAAQDMGKVGAMQDLIRGVEKIIGKKQADPTLTTQPVQQIVQQVVQGGGPNVTAMIERGHQALEDGEWSKADDFFDQALNMDAKCAEAFLGKFLAQERSVSLDDSLDKRLEECGRKAVNKTKMIDMDKARENKIVEANCVPGYLDKNQLTQNLKFDPSYPSRADYFANQAKEGKESLRMDRLFARTLRYASGSLAESMKSSLRRFDQALDELAKTAKSREEQLRQDREIAYAEHLSRQEKKIAEMREASEKNREQDYQEACKLRQTAETIPEYEQAIKKLTCTGLVGYKDSLKLADECCAAIAELEEEQREREEAAIREREAREMAADRLKQEKEAAQKKKRLLLSGICFALASAMWIVQFCVDTHYCYEFFKDDFGFVGYKYFFRAAFLNGFYSVLLGLGLATIAMGLIKNRPKISAIGSISAVVGYLWLMISQYVFLFYLLIDLLPLIAFSFLALYWFKQNREIRYLTLSIAIFSVFVFISALDWIHGLIFIGGPQLTGVIYYLTLAAGSLLVKLAFHPAKARWW